MRPFRTIIPALTIVIAAVMVLAFAKAPASSSGGQQSCTTPDFYTARSIPVRPAHAKA